MKLVPPERGTSFYESFSDLIFNTLVVFIILVLGLVLKLQTTTHQMLETTAQVKATASKATEEEARAKAAEAKAKAAEAKSKEAEDKAKAAQAKAEDEQKKAKDLAAQLATATSKIKQEMQTLVYPNRFSGGAARTYCHLTHIRLNNIEYVVFVPETLVTTYGLVRKEDRTDPRLEMARLLLEDEGLTLLTINQIGQMGADAPVHAAGTLDTIFWYAPGLDLQLMFAANQNLRLTAGLQNARRLRDATGGYDASGNLSPQLIAVYRAYQQFTGEAAGDWTTLSNRMRADIGKLVTAPANYTPKLRFTAPLEGRIRVGNLALSTKQFMNIIRAIKPGKGFYVEYVSPTGKPEPPPTWVVKQILEPLGYDGRMLSEEGLKALDEKKP